MKLDHSYSVCVCVCVYVCVRACVRACVCVCVFRSMVNLYYGVKPWIPPCESVCVRVSFTLRFSWKHDVTAVLNSYWSRAASPSPSSLQVSCSVRLMLESESRLCGSSHRAVLLNTSI